HGIADEGALWTGLNPIFDVESGFAKSGFVCTITLPSNASVRTVTSDVMRSKKLAKQHAALRACVALHHEGGLDDYLMPFRVKVAEDLPFTEQDLQGRKKKLRKYPIQIPKLWGITAAGPKEPVPPDDALNSPSPVPATAPAPPLIMSRLHMTLLHLDRDAALAATGQTYHPLALLTARPLPDTCDFWLYFEMSTTPVNMQIRGLGPPVSLDLTQLKLLMKYTLNICSAPVNKEFICEPHDFPFLVCPLLTEKVGRSGFPAGNGAEVATVASVHLIDWPSVRTTVARRFYSISLPALNDPTTSAGVLDMVIVDHADEGRRYFVKAIRRDLMPHTYIAEPSPREKLAGVNTIADYYLKKFQRKPTQALQPLLEVTKISKTLNYLTPHQGQAEAFGGQRRHPGVLSGLLHPGAGISVRTPASVHSHPAGQPALGVGGAVQVHARCAVRVHP
ncbi:MAG: dicer dimerization domain-containing protein, partial [Olpidium bornovanus]